MMIPILKDYYSPGYLPDSKPKSIPPYLPNVNLAMRRKMFEDLGGYDEACSAGEDADLCIRASRAGWAQFFENRAQTFHEPRPNVRSLVRQWIWYGRGGSHFFFKQQEKRFELYLDLELTPKMHRYRRVLAIRWFPLPAMLFISAFLLGHGLALLGALIFIAGLWKTSAVFLAAAIILPLCLYRRSSLKRLSLRDLLLYAGFAYLINATCILASSLEGLKKRRLFIYPGI
jgi:cellulose synthase/poly-beta-1,6-N-acetylglucosamine synthase-like glycosyltransferase